MDKKQKKLPPLTGGSPAPAALLQVYAFSSENWRRPPAEVDGLLSLICRVLQAELAELAATGVRLRFIGELAMLPQPLQRQIRRWAGALAGGRLLAGGWMGAHIEG
jgi:undecaprenyl diphosphate synthase